MTAQPNMTLHPARAEYLRRGTPVVRYESAPGLATGEIGGWEDSRCGLVLGPLHDGRYEWHEDNRTDSVSLDLTDPTARAHAAWAYTATADDGDYIEVIPGPMLFGVHAVLDRAVHAANTERQADKAMALRDEADRQMRTLCRMAAGDPTVTPEEAKAALVWAEGVVDA